MRLTLIILLAIAMTGCSSARVRAFGQGFAKGYNTPVATTKNCIAQPMYGTDNYQVSCQ